MSGSTLSSFSLSKSDNCSALEELEDKIDKLGTLGLDEAIQSEEDHKYDLARLYQIFFSTRDFYVSPHNPDELSL